MQAFYDEVGWMRSNGFDYSALQFLHICYLPQFLIFHAGSQWMCREAHVAIVDFGPHVAANWDYGVKNQPITQNPRRQNHSKTEYKRRDAARGFSPTARHQQERQGCQKRRIEQPREAPGNPRPSPRS